MDFTSFENQNYDFGTEPAAEREKLNYLPGKEKWPFTIRILPHPEEKAIYHRTDSHWIQAGGRWFNIPCRRINRQACPLCDASWKYKELIADLEMEGAKSEDSPKHQEWREAIALHKTLQVTRSHAFLAAQENDENIYVFTAKNMLLGQIFGNSVKQIEGAVKAIQEYGVPVFDPTANTGWIKVNKTGKNLDTIYTASLIEETILQGKSKVKELAEKPLHESIAEKYKSGDFSFLPKISEKTANDMWSEDEMQKFLDSDFTETPARWGGGAGEAKPTKSKSDVSSDMVIPGMSDPQDYSDVNDDVPF